MKRANTKINNGIVKKHKPYHVFYLNDDCLSNVFDNFTAKQTLKYALVNKQFNRVSRRELHWKSLYNDFNGGNLFFEKSMKRFTFEEFTDLFDGNNPNDTYLTKYKKYYCVYKIYFKYATCGGSSREYFSFKANSVPIGINYLTGLQHLLLDNCHLTSIPPTIGELTNLQNLHIQDNQIQLLPNELSNLTNIYHLRMDNNQFDHFPHALLSLTNLNHLQADKNKIKSLPKNISSLTNLTMLNLNDNELECLPVEFKYINKLSSLDLNGNKLKAIPSEIISMSDMIIYYKWQKFNL